MSEPYDEAELKQLIAALEPSDFELDTPPADLWSRIEASAQLDVSETDGTAAGDGGSADGPAEVVPLRPRRLSPRIMLAAAAMLLVVGIGVALVVNSSSGTDEGTVLAVADLSDDGLQVPAAGAGSATLVDVDGELFLDIEVPELAADVGFFEIWVIDTDVVGMQSLGIVTESARFALPPGLDPAVFPVVDISLEPLDGDPTHSGQSTLRGVLS